MTTKLPIATGIDPFNQRATGPTLEVNELFGPTIQGEGVEVGRPCMFVRLHRCPVHCPGCDTAYTWDGTEKGKSMTVPEIAVWLQEQIREKNAKGCGVVLSGGEPLLHIGNLHLIELMSVWKLSTWSSLETSGYAGTFVSELQRQQLGDFLRAFTTVHLSPKVTPCLHGLQTDEQLLSNVEMIMAVFAELPQRLAFKFVVNDEKDLDVVRNLDVRYKIGQRGHRIYLMPYGMYRDEVLAAWERLIPDLASTGYILSPRLHSIIWGAKRGV